MVVVVSGFDILVVPVLNVNHPVVLAATTGAGVALNIIFGTSSSTVVFAAGVKPNEKLGASFFLNQPVTTLDRHHHRVLPTSHTLDNPVRVIRTAGHAVLLVVWYR